MRSVTMALAAALLGSFVSGAAAQDSSYPKGPITVICPYAAGGGGDIMVRYYATKLEQVSGATVIVENRVGAAGHLGTMAAREAPADGLTMLITSNSTLVGNTFTMAAADYDPRSALDPVATLFHLGLALVVDTESPIQSVADLTAYLKEKKGDASYGAATSSAVVATNMYFNLADVAGFRVNYKASSDAVRDIASGQLDFAFVDVTLGIASQKQGSVRMLAVTPSERAPGAPDTPTMKEAGVPDFHYSVNWGAWFPPGVPQERQDRMHEWLNQVAEADDTRGFLANGGAQPLLGSVDDARKVLDGDVAVWTEISDIAGLVKQ